MQQMWLQLSFIDEMSETVEGRGKKTGTPIIIIIIIPYCTRAQLFLKKNKSH
jgi:hypothetical protein